MNVVGVPNQGTHNLSSLISNNVQGWNLVGNPFASSISWASVYAASGGAASGLYDYVEMYDYTIGDWNGYTSGSGIEIGSSQGFWVYGLPGATTLTLIIPESAKTTTSNSTIKTMAATPGFILKISGKGSPFSHTFHLKADADASDEFDNKDIPFHRSPNRATPQLYSTSGNRKINTNVFSGLSDNFDLELQAGVSYNGRFRLDAAGLDQLQEYTCIRLEDRLSNSFTDLRSQPYYEFDMNAGDNPSRFVLHLSKTTDHCASSMASAEELESNAEVLSTPGGNRINFSFSEAVPVTIEVVNVLGQQLVEPKQVIAAYSSEDIVLPEGYTGLYFIRIISEQEVIVKELFRK